MANESARTEFRSDTGRPAGFGGDPNSSVQELYVGAARWEVGKPQPVPERLIEELPPEGRILDLGCGAGGLPIILAERWLEVVGVDFVEAAIAERTG